MKDDRGLLEALKEINSISHNNKLLFDRKLHLILSVIVRCMLAKSGSIILVKGRKKLEVAASTNKDLVGVKQTMEDGSPSLWVVQNRRPLYVDSIDNSDSFQKRFDHYEGSAFLMAPVISDKKIIGIISVTDKIGRDIFSKEEQGILLDIAGQVISSIENNRLMESLKKQRRSLKKKNLELQKLERLRTDLFNMLVHDLKGPISDLMANLDILSYKISDGNREYLESAKTGCDTLYNMVSNLMDLVRLEEGRLKLLHERIDPKELIKETIARLFTLITIKELKFVEKFPAGESVDHLFWGDRGILLRVLINLLTNAINYSPQGDMIEVGFGPLNSDEMEFFVNDNGPGVAPEYREAIFEKYVQLEKRGDGRIYTTGLGLTFCKMAVEAHGGRIRVESKESGKGSSFVFRLPIDMKRKH